MTRLVLGWLLRLTRFNFFKEFYLFFSENKWSGKFRYSFPLQYPFAYNFF